MTVVKRRIVLDVIDEDESGDGVLVKRGGAIETLDSLTGFEEAKAEKQVLAFDESDRDLMSGTSITTGRVLLLESFATIRVKLDDTTDTGIVVKPPDSDDDTIPGKLYLEGEFTHIYVTPIGASDDVIVVVSVVGA